MSSAQQLPHEILENIFRLVVESLEKGQIEFRRPSSSRNHELLNFARVCQAWYLPACRVLYEKITRLHKVRMMRSFTLQRKNLGVFCKEIDLNDVHHVHEQFSTEQYQEFFSYLPNLQKVKVGKRNTYSDLTELARNVNQIKHLKELTLGPSNISERKFQVYRDCMFAFRETLQHIELPEPNAPVTANNGENIGPIYKFLPNFNRLTSLIIRNPKFKGSPTLSTFRIIHLCPNLVKLDWMSDLDEREADESHCELKHDKIEDLTISLPELNTQLLTGIATKMTKLKRLEVTQHLNLSNSSSQQVQALDQLHHWRTYYSSLKRVYFSIRYTLPSTIFNHWLYVDGLIGNNSSTPTHISLALTTSFHQIFPFKFMVDKGAESTSVHCTIDMNQLSATRVNNNVSDSFQPLLFPLDSSTSSSGNDRMVQTYDLHCTPQNNEDLQMLSDLRSSIFVLALQRFPNIRYFNMVFSTSVYNSYASSQIAAVSHETDYDKEHRSILPLMTKQRHPHPDPTNVLAYVILRGIPSPVEIATIMMLLPNTQYLTLVDSCKELDANYNVTLDLSGFHLKHLKLDLSTLAMHNSGKQTLVLQIEEEENNLKHYYKWKRETRKIKNWIFEPVAADFATKFGRFTSKNCHIVTIKLNRVELFVVSSKLDYRSYYYSQTCETVILQ